MHAGTRQRARRRRCARSARAACVERSSLQCSIRGSITSSAKRVWPVTLARPSTRRRGLADDVHRVSRSAKPSRSAASELSGRLADRRDRRFDGLEDLLIAGAAAQVSGERLADLVARRVGVLVEQRLRRDQEARRAVAALRGAEVGEGLLQRMQAAVGHQAFDGLDLAAVALDAEDQAREHRLAVEQHGAGAALAELAAVLGAAEVRDPRAAPRAASCTARTRPRSASPLTVSAR